MTVARLRLAAATAASVAVTCALVVTAAPLPVSNGRFFWLWIIIAAPVVAAALVWVPKVEAQLLARGVWWGTMLTGALLSGSGPPKVGHFGVRLVWFAGAALLFAGSLGLEPRGRFQPVAFRGTLLLSLVLAMADAGALLVFGLASFLNRGSLSILALAVPMTVGVIGLLRLRTWGLLVSLASNLLVASLAYKRVVDLPDPLRGLYIVTAVVQLLVPAPMLVTIIRRRPASTREWTREKQIGRTTIVFALMAASTYLGWFHAPLWL